MAQVPETFNMNSNGLTFSKRHQFTISKNLALFIVCAFVVCIVITALVSYFITKQASHKVCQEGHTAIRTEFPNTKDGTTVSTFSTPPDDNPEKERPNLRLPRSVLPLDYDLHILTILENKTFEGVNKIRINVTEEVQNITLHALGIEVDCEKVMIYEVVTKKQDSQAVQVSNCSWQKEEEFFVIHMAETIRAGEFNVHVNFGGVLNEDLAGYYISSYEVNNETRWLAATQFEPTDARRAFPCFDEPALKATFKITLGRSNDLISLSNMPLNTSTPHETLVGYTWDHFQRSVPMSTYLVAYIVCDFTPRTSKTFSVYARKSAYSQMATAIEIGPKLLAHLEQFFGISFPLPKMDLLAVPDFSAGAMENWGLITFRETGVMYEAGISPKSQLQHVTTVIAHELGHQWFGNLVTPKWWSDLWLNEGFASYLEYSATNALFPEWKMMDQFVVTEVQRVMNLDALKSSHPISTQVENPNEINDIFDKISYTKGETIIRMIEDFMTTASFRKGLTNYLNEKKYSNADQDDLWASLTKQAHLDNTLDPTITIKEVMDTWTRQMGFPVINITRTSNNRIRVTQERFEIARTSPRANYTWWVFLTYQTRSGTPQHSWMTNKQIEMDLVNVVVPPDEWFLVNLNQTGYYRVNYDDLGWSLVGRQLWDDHAMFDPKNRAQIMNDVLSLASAGYMKYSTALNTTVYLKKEEDYIPWSAALDKMDYLLEMIQRTGYFDKFKVFLVDLLRPIYTKIGFVESQNEPLLKTYLRQAVLERVCRLGIQDCLEWSHTEFRNWMLSPNPDTLNTISPNVRNIVYCNAIQIGGEPLWTFAWKRYVKANVGSERELLIAAMGCTRETWLLNTYMRMAITPGSGIRKQDIILVFRSIGAQIVGQTAAMRFVISNWREISNYTGHSISMMNSILMASMLNLNTPLELQELKEFADEVKDDGSFSQGKAMQIIEQTQANIDWIDKYLDEIVDWLCRYQQQIANV